MANCGYLALTEGDELDPDQIEQWAAEFFAERFPLFTTKSEPSLHENCWIYRYKDDGYLALVFYIGKTEVWEDKDDEEEPDVVPAVVFRHGHSYDLLYWIEQELQVFLQQRLTEAGYEVSALDDGVPGHVYTFGACPTYWDYVSEKVERYRQISGRADVKELGRGSSQDHRITEAIEALPAPFIKYLGLPDWYRSPKELEG